MKNKHKDGTYELRQAKRGQRIVYSLKATIGRKVDAIFIKYNPYVWQFNSPTNIAQDASFDLYHLDACGLQTRVTISEDLIYQAKFVDSFPYETMDFDVGI